MQSVARDGLRFVEALVQSISMVKVISSLEILINEYQQLKDIHHHLGL